MKLSDQERRILVAAELHASASLDELQERSGLGKNSIRYAIQKLQSRGIIKRVPFIDVYPFGLTDFVVYFSITSRIGTLKMRQGLDELLKQSYVTWMGELGGSYQHSVAVFAKSVSEFFSFLEYMGRLFEGMTIKKTVRISKRFTRYNRTYLSPDIQKEHMDFGASERTVELDELDEKILLTMVNDSSLTSRQQAMRIGIPDSTWHHRLRKLKADGIYIGDLFVIDTTRLGYTFYNLQIHTNGLYLDLEQKIRAWAESHPHVVHLIESIAAWDFEIGVEAEMPHQITEVVSELYEKFGGDIVQIDMVPIFANKKYNFFRPLNILLTGTSIS